MPSSPSRRPSWRGARRVPAALALTLLGTLSACGGGGEPTPPTPAPVATVQVTPGTGAMYIGATLPLAVQTFDANGTVLAGRAIAYSSSNTSVATVSGTGASGAVTAVASGTATITITSETKTATVAISVTPVPVASVVVTPATATVGIGGTTQLSATTRDSTGATLAGRTVAWTTSNAAVATVSAAGVVSGVASGTATIRATAEGKFAEATVTVSAASTPTIVSMAPAVLLPGGAATITGTGFSATVADNTVTIDGVAATVTSASTTQLGVTVPALPCLPTHDGRVQVVTQGLGVTALQPVRAGTTVAVDANYTQRLLSPSEATCAELPAGAGKFVVSVFDMDGTPTNTLGFRLSGGVPPASLASLTQGSVALRERLAVPTRRSASAAPDPLVGGAAQLTAEQMHASILESNRAIYARLRGTSRRTASRSLSPAPRSAVTLPAVGSTRKFRVAQFSTAVGAVGSCNDFVEITARVVYVGTHGIVYEDTAAPLANTMDSYYRTVGQEFDNSMYTVDSTYFGDPLLTDPGTDGDQHLNMVFTPSITTGIAGFVISCDFFPRNTTDNQVSNLGENFYAVVPTATGTGYQTNTADSWLRGMRHTLVHEVKHIASFAARIVGNASTFEESWLEEGMARHAEELWERNDVYNVAWKGNTGYRESAYCDVRPGFPECPNAPFGIFNHFATLYTALTSPGAYSMFGRVADGDFNFYATSWSFVRYSLDRYATNEASFLRGITQSTTTSGLTSISAQTGGHSPTELLTNWSLAMYLDDLTTNPDLSFPTWNTHDIYQGMKTDFSTTYTLPFPLVPQPVASASFQVDNAGIHGGSFALYQVPSTTSSSTTLRIAGPNGVGAASSLLRMTVVRVP